jgi:hypothetical protein
MSTESAPKQGDRGFDRNPGEPPPRTSEPIEEPPRVPPEVPEPDGEPPPDSPGPDAPVREPPADDPKPMRAAGGMGREY